MEIFAVAVFPIAKLEEWKQFAESASTGERSEGHKSFLRRIGVKREHIHHMPSPMGDIAILIWEGVSQDQVPELMGQVMGNPQTDHERYIATHVIPVLHGVDLSAGPPPEVKRVATTEA